MLKLFSRACHLSLLSAVTAALAFSGNVNVGYVSFDLTFAPNVGQFDITNETGPNSTLAPDTTFPVTNPVSLSALSLVVNFKSGPSATFGSSYFTLNADGLSFDGNPSFNIASDPVTSAVLTGTFATTAFTLNNGTSMKVNPAFSATVTDPSGKLQDGDFAVIVATPAGGGVSPEPAAWILLSSGLVIVLLVSRRSRSRKAASTAAFLVAALAMVPAMNAQDKVRLNTNTSPGSGVAGTTQVWVAGSGFPNPLVPANVTVTLAASCGGAAVATTTATAVRQIIGSSDRIEFLVPGSPPLAAALYYVTVAGKSSGGTTFTSSNCSSIQVTVTATVLGSCNPGSSMGILAPAAVKGKTVPVTAYVPNASWYYTYGTGVQAIPLEGGGTATSIPTADYINSCSTNSVTGVSVCTSNGAGALVYLLSGTKVTTTVKSASDSIANFSGGSCYNCGVAVNSVANQAVITMGYSKGASALQFLDLNTNTFGAVIPTVNEVSEDVLWDPFSNRVLSPNESEVYDIFEIAGGGLPSPGTVTESSMALSVNGEPDSAGEDCTTGIALTVGEGTGNVFLADLRQATFTGKTWAAPNAVYELPEFESLSAGASAVAVAPGSTHLGVVAGEFGGNYIGIIQLPAKSGAGAGTPAIVDYVLALLPNTPDGNAFSNGYDPHTTTAYTSPNTQKAYGVAASWATGVPTYVAIIDLKAILAAARTGPHTVSSAVDLLATGIVRYVKATP